MQREASVFPKLFQSWNSCKIKNWQQQQQQQQNWQKTLPQVIRKKCSIHF